MLTKKTLFQIDTVIYDKTQREYYVDQFLNYLLDQDLLPLTFFNEKTNPLYRERHFVLVNDDQNTMDITHDNLSKDYRELSIQINWPKQQIILTQYI